MINYNDFVMIIPSLSPDERLVELVGNLKKEGLNKILVVNDGSTSEYDVFFEGAKECGAVVLTHAQNRGKGCALKTAFEYILNNWQETCGVVTLDSDGQHLVKDVKACCNMLYDNQDSMILGCRQFDKDIPFKSRFGNVITVKMFKLFVGLNISDTQTGLRAFSTKLLGECIKIKGERFEYETNMLIYCKEKNIGIKEVPIETVYYNNNKSTHFRPFKDSICIYKLFLRFIAASMSSFVIDITMFSLLTFFFKDIFKLQYIFIATIGARIISSIYNYIVNCKAVFKLEGIGGKTFVRYYILAIAQMLLSAGGVFTLFRLIGTNEVLIKLLVDSILFILSFQIQREWVFKKKNQ